MLSKYIMPGDKIELTPIRQKRNQNGEEEKKVFASKVSEIINEDQLEIVMPMEKTKLILLPVDAEYEICFYSKSGIYLCKARVIDRYKSEGVYLLLVELTSNLRKNQRREFYRFNCILNMSSRELVEEELSAIDDNKLVLERGMPLQHSIIVDISGGGIRFVSNYRYEQGTIIYLTYNLFVGGVEKSYELTGKILMVKELENRKGQYEHRVQYVTIKNQDREEIIRYIFEEERKNRQRK